MAAKKVFNLMKSELQEALELSKKELAEGKDELLNLAKRTTSKVKGGRQCRKLVGLTYVLTQACFRSAARAWPATITNTASRAHTTTETPPPHAINPPKNQARGCTNTITAPSRWYARGRCVQHSRSYQGVSLRLMKNSLQSPQIRINVFDFES